MQNSKLVKDMLKEIKESYEYEMGDFFPDKDSNSKVYESFLSDTKNFISDNRPANIAFDTLENISFWHLSVGQYKAMTNNANDALNEFIMSLSYGYLYMKSYIDAWQCLKADAPIYIDKAVMFLSQTIIAQWWSESSYLAESIINSVNPQKNDSKELNGIILSGMDKSSVSWYILKLYSKYFDKKLNNKNKFCPDDMTIYENALNIWDSKDLAKVQQTIYALAEYRLYLIKSLEGEENYYYEFGDSIKWLFPYEILVWLKLRELKGLKNPTKFTHPLMNTPIAKFFLSLETPLPYPSELPYAKELLEKLKEQCPNVEIPEWLDKTETQIIPDDFMK